MAEPKTKPTQHSVSDFIQTITPIQKQQDCQQLVDIMQEITQTPAVLWGTSIIGFGEYHYQYESGHKGNAPLTGFSPRKQNLALYVMPGFTQQQDLLEKLGKHTTGKSCLYIKSLADVDIKILKKIIAQGVACMKQKYSFL